MFHGMPTFTADDGVEIAYDVWDGDPGQPLVLLHHGFIANGHVNWVAPGVVAALTATGRRVATIDARGHGASGKPHDPAFYGESRMARDVSTLADVLGEPLYDLAGYSMGAIVSLLTAVSDSRVRRLVIGGIGAGVVELGGVDTRVVRRDALRHALTTDQPATIADPSAAAFRAFVEAVGGDRTALAAQVAAAHDRPIPLGEITAPTLVLAGERDNLATRPEVLAAAIPGSVLRMVPGDHLGAVREPALTRALVSFLNTGAPV